MDIVRGRAVGSPAQPKTDTFTGVVWADPVLPSSGGTTVNDVFFSPGARTYWHHHEKGQILQVVSGSGLVCTAGERPARIEPGDLVWVPPGERHWHGAALGSYLLHRAISLGTTVWGEPVDDEIYHSGAAEGSTRQRIVHAPDRPRCLCRGGTRVREPHHCAAEDNTGSDSE